MKIEHLNQKLSGLVDLFCEEQLEGDEVDENEAVEQFRTWLEQLYVVGELGKPS